MPPHYVWYRCVWATPSSTKIIGSKVYTRRKCLKLSLSLSFRSLLFFSRRTPNFPDAFSCSIFYMYAWEFLVIQMARAAVVDDWKNREWFDFFHQIIKSDKITVDWTTVDWIYSSTTKCRETMASFLFFFFFFNL